MSDTSQIVQASESVDTPPPAELLNSRSKLVEEILHIDEQLKKNETDLVALKASIYEKRSLVHAINKTLEEVYEWKDEPITGSGLVVPNSVQSK